MIRPIETGRHRCRPYRHARRHKCRPEPRALRHQCRPEPRVVAGPAPPSSSGSGSGSAKKIARPAPCSPAPFLPCTKNARPKPGVLIELAGVQGLEPRFYGPEPHVLPLDDTPAGTRIIPIAKSWSTQAFGRLRFLSSDTGCSMLDARFRSTLPTYEPRVWWADPVSRIQDRATPILAGGRPWPPAGWRSCKRRRA